MIPVAWGEVIDKITILEIKSRRLTAEEALANVARELRYLRDCAAEALRVAGVESLALRLKTINEALWDAEEIVRQKERGGHFDHEFVATARSIYAGNDERAKIKRQINTLLGSDIVEEKNYRTSERGI